MAKPKRKVARPRKVKIGEKDYRVTEKKNLHCYVKRKVRGKGKIQTKRQKLYGWIMWDPKRHIELCKDQKHEDLVDTFIHEIFHGIIEEYDIKLDKRKEEHFVLNLSTGFKDVLLKNPQFVEWMKNKLDDLREKAAQS